MSFANPAALWALLALPALFFLLRLTPPRPQQVSFPPFRLLLGLMPRQDSPARTPWWLIALRLALAACVILAVARPIRGGDMTALLPGGSGPILVVVDDGWAAAPNWQARQAALSAILDRAAAENRKLALVTTTPAQIPPELAPAPAESLRARAAALQPKALTTDRAALTARLVNLPPDLSVIWLADGLGGEDFARGLAKLGPLTIRSPAAAELPPVISSAGLKDGRIAVTLRRAVPPRAGEDSLSIDVRAANGRSLANTVARFAPGSTSTEAAIDLPLQLRNEARRIDVTGTASAAAVWLLDDRARRKAVGIVSGAAGSASEPLLAATFYIARAVEPFAETRTAEAGQSSIPALLADGLSMLALADVGTLTPDIRDAVSEWVEAGGVLVRFAGPRLAAAHDDLVPVELRGGGRELGGAMSWEKPQAVAGFTADTPFEGLALAGDQVTVSKQVLAEPGPGLSGHVWASLADGTPLVTAARRGKGLIVLFHTTATPDWSNLALSGLFVDMLRRLADLAPALGSGSADAGSAADSAAAAYAPQSALDGFGAAAAMPPEAAPIPAAEIDSARPSPQHPAGLYQRGGASRALNVAPQESELVPLAAEALPAGTRLAGYAADPGTALAGPLLAAALISFALDGLAVLLLAGSALPFAAARRRASAVALLAALACVQAPHQARAQEIDAATATAMQASLDTHLAYVITGDATVDDTSAAGLGALSSFLTERTAVEPGPPIGVDIEKDDLSFFPLIYWPVLPDAPEPSPAALAKLDRFMKNGGTIFLDTRDAGTVPDGATGPAGEALQRILARLDIPPLEPVPDGHVLTKSFYLLQSFPGRFDRGRLWVETADAGADADGVSTIIIGSNDYAAAWAADGNGVPLYPAVPGGEAQREMAYRSGVNIVMYTLTGNYKADQVHVPELLERLGQ